MKQYSESIISLAIAVIMLLMILAFFDSQYDRAELDNRCPNSHIVTVDGVFVGCVDDPSNGYGWYPGIKGRNDGDRQND